MECKTRIFGIIKLCLVVVIIVLSVGLSVFSSGGDRNVQLTTEDMHATATETDTEHSADDDMIAKTEIEHSAGDYTPADVIGDIIGYGADIYREADIQKVMQNMTVEEKVGQLFFLCVKDRFDEKLLDSYKIGGILLFGSDISGENRESLAAKITAFQENSEIPLLVGIDEEGGTVSRLNSNSRLIDYIFQSPRDLYAKGGLEAVSEDTVNKCALLNGYGINVNFAPVCDISEKNGDYMYQRSLGENPEVTADYVSTVVGIMNEYRVGSVLKHFPGYGSNGDTHKSVMRDSRDYDEFKQRDFVPFIAGMEAGAGCVLVSHNIVECMDADVPASLSPEVHRVLRDELGFDGVIITDDLSMDGVLDFMDNSEAAVQAVLAGNDMIIATYYQEQYSAVLKACREGRISEDRLNDSVRRVLIWKQSLGLSIYNSD